MIYTVTLNPAVDREYLVPRLTPNTVLRATEVNIDFGGKGFNVSRMLHFLGIENTALGFIGGKAGQILEQGLTSIGIKTDFVHVAEETRTNTTIVGKEGRDHYKVNQSGAFVTQQELDQFFRKVTTLINKDDWWILAGSLPPGVPNDTYQQLIQLVQSGGAKAVLDTSGKALSLGINASPFLIKPNIFEAQMLTGITNKSMDAMIEMINIILAKGVPLVSISAGKDFSLFSTGCNVWKAVPPDIQEANPIGAGDAMLAGMIYGLSTGLSEKESFAWGIAAGSAAAANPGTRMPAIIEVRKLLEKVKIDQIQC